MGATRSKETNRGIEESNQETQEGQDGPAEEDSLQRLLFAVQQELSGKL